MKTPKSLDLWLDRVILRLQNNKDFVLLLTGEERAGKSTAALYLLQLFQEKLGREFTLDLIEKNMTYQDEDFRNRIESLPGLSMVIHDESQESMDSQRSMTKEQHGLRVVFSVMGFKNHFVVLIIPEISEIGTKFQKRTNAWIHILDRDKYGNKKYLLFTKSRDPTRRHDPYGLMRMERSKLVARNDRQVVSKLKRLPSYSRQGLIPGLDEDLLKYYNAISVERKKKILSGRKEGGPSPLLMLGQLVTALHPKLSLSKMEKMGGPCRQTLSKAKKEYENYTN